MKYEAVISAYAFEDLPEKIKLEDGARFIIEKAEIIINEIDNSKDPICPAGIEKGYSVALKLSGVRRTINKTDELKFSVINEPDYYGEHICLGEDAKLKDVIDAVNGFIQNVKTKSI
jgi:hypothetical protein